MDYGLFKLIVCMAVDGRLFQDYFRVAPKHILGLQGDSHMLTALLIAFVPLHNPWIAHRFDLANRYHVTCLSSVLADLATSYSVFAQKKICSFSHF